MTANSSNYVLWIKFIVSDHKYCDDVFMTFKTVPSKNRPLFTFEEKFTRDEPLKDIFKREFNKHYFEVYKKEYEFDLNKTTFYVKCHKLLYINGSLCMEEALKEAGAGRISTVYVMIL